MTDTGGLGPQSGRGELFGHGRDDFDGRLARWSAEVRADEAARARARERWLRQQALEAATLAGVLVDIAERRQLAAVHVEGARVHRGTVEAVGSDVVALTDDHGHDVFVAFGAITGVVAGAAGREPTGDRAASDLLLADVFADLAADRVPVQVTVRGGASWTGFVSAAGVDIATIRAGADGHDGTVHVPLAAVVDAICR